MTRRTQVTWRHPGGRKPDDVVVVARPSRWGNPYPVEVHGREEAIAMFCVYAEGRLRDDPGWLEPLRGKRLACYCGPGQACHADALIALLEADR